MTYKLSIKKFVSYNSISSYLSILIWLNTYIVVIKKFNVLRLAHVYFTSVLGGKRSTLTKKN